MTFRVWEATVNRIFESRHGIGLDDLPDMPTRDWYDAGLEPDEAANEAWERFNDPIYGGF